MKKEIVFDLFEKGFSIDYIINHIYHYENKNFINYKILNGRVILDNNYISKDIVKNFVYNTLYEYCIKNRNV